MYTYVSSIGKHIDNDGIWEEFDINSFALNRVLTEYRQVLVLLSNPFGKFTLNLSDVSTEISIINTSLTDWLASLGNRALPVINGHPILKKKYAKRKDLIKADYKFQPVIKDGMPDKENSLSDKVDLFLEKKGIDPIDFYKHCMVSVNGYWHQLDASTQGIWVRDGYQTMKIAKENHLSVLSFKGVGTLEYVPITEDMIYKQVPTAPLYDQLYINIKRNTTNKTIILVLGGYMHVLDWLTFRRVGDNLLRVDLKNLPYLKRIHESMDVIGIKPLMLEEGHSPDHIGIKEITSDDVIRRYLTMSQSFIVLLNNDSIYLERHQLESLPVPGKYISSIIADKPMFTGVGKVGEYWDTYDDGEWLLTLYNNPYFNRHYATTDYMNEVSVNGALLPEGKTDNADSYLLEIGTVAITYK